MRILLLLSVTLLLFSCSPFDADLLNGEWSSVSWTDETNNRAFNHTMQGDFNDDGRYVITINEHEEKGKYWIFGEFLHTVEDGQSEKKVKILKLTPDSLEILMNRSGQMEKVVLVKNI